MQSLKAGTELKFTKQKGISFIRKSILRPFGSYSSITYLADWILYKIEYYS